MSHITQSKAGWPQPGLDAAREGRSFCMKVSAKTGIDSEQVLTDSTFLKAIPNGYRLVVKCFYMYLSTLSDWATMEIVTTENEDGTGQINVLSPKFRIDTGAAAIGSLPSLVSFDPPMIVTRTQTSRALTAQVQGNDANAALTLGFNGWQELDVDTN